MVSSSKQSTMHFSHFCDRRYSRSSRSSESGVHEASSPPPLVVVVRFEIEGELLLGRARMGVMSVMVVTIRKKRR